MTPFFTRAALSLALLAFIGSAPANVAGEANVTPPSPGGIHTPTRGSASPRSESERPRLHRLVVEYGPLETIEQFVKSGADINVRDQNGNTVLHLLMNDPTLTRPYLPPPTWLRRNAGAVGWRAQAVRWLEHHGLISPAPVRTNLLVLDFLLRLGADPRLSNSEGRTPLHLLGGNEWASEAQLSEYQAAARKLMGSGALLEARDLAGDTPLLLAMRQGALRWADLLVQLGANPKVSSKEGDTPLHLLAMKSRSDPAALAQSRAVLSRLLQGGASWEARNRAGDAPIHSALRSPDPRNEKWWGPNHGLIDLMFELGADPATTNSLGTPALDLLLAQGGAPLGVLERWIAANHKVVHSRDRRGRTPIFYTLTNHGLLYDTLFVLTKAGANPLAGDNQGDTFLHRLLAYPDDNWGTQELVSRWLPANADINVTNHGGDTLLHLAVRNNRWSFVRPLLDRGANVLARNAAGETPLFLAHQHNQFAEAGYVRPPEVPESFRDAIMRGNTNMVGIYLKAEPRLVSTPDGHGTLPIDYAAYPPQPWVARQFLAAGSPLTPGVAVILGRVRDFPRLLNPLDPAARDWLLYVAVITSQLDSLVWLLEHGANPNSQDESGFTPAYYLSLRKGAPPELAQMLEKHGATPSLFDAIAKGDQSTLERLLAAQPASARATNRAGQTPLLRAIFATNRLAFDRLLERGADVNAATSRCFTPLHAAAALGRDDFAAELLGRGADPRACDEFSDTPLHWAARSGATKVADLLLAAGADVNAQNGNERLGHWNSPLHTAAENFQIEMVQWLLQHGADLNVTNQYKFTPLEQARQGRWSGRVWERGLSPIQPDPTLRAATIAALEKAQPATPQPQ